MNKLTRQEEVKKAIADTIKQAYIDGYNARANGEVWEQDDGSVKLPEQGILIKTFHLERELHSQGVVIKVDKELPDIEGIFADVAKLSKKEHKNVLGDKWKFITPIEEELAGCVAVEPLMEEVSNGR